MPPALAIVLREPAHGRNLVSPAPLHLTVIDDTWPRPLVPPELRDRPGAVARARERRRRLAGGLAPTSHQVVVDDMRPSAAHPDLVPPQLILISTSSRTRMPATAAARVGARRGGRVA